MAKTKWYVVIVGTAPGIYTTWLDVAPKVNGVPGAVHQGFAKEEDAIAAFERARVEGKIAVIGGQRGQGNVIQNQFPGHLAASPMTGVSMRVSSSDSSPAPPRQHGSLTATVHSPGTRARSDQRPVYLEFDYSHTSPASSSPPTGVTQRASLHSSPGPQVRNSRLENSYSESFSSSPAHGVRHREASTLSPRVVNTPSSELRYPLEDGRPKSLTSPEIQRSPSTSFTHRESLHPSPGPQVRNSRLENSHSERFSSSPAHGVRDREASTLSPLVVNTPSSELQYPLEDGHRRSLTSPAIQRSPSTSVFESSTPRTPRGGAPLDYPISLSSSSSPRTNVTQREPLSPSSQTPARRTEGMLEFESDVSSRFRTMSLDYPGSRSPEPELSASARRRPLQASRSYTPGIPSPRAPLEYNRSPRSEDIRSTPSRDVNEQRSSRSRVTSPPDHVRSPSGSTAGGSSRAGRECCDCKCHPSPRSSRSPATSSSSRISSPRSNGQSSLGLYQQVHIANAAYDASLDPRSPVSRTTAVPLEPSMLPVFGRPSPVMSVSRGVTPAVRP
ncbi:hypothetical protein JAAARDRAFT_69592 [Jaapia argillacea MUCL 33604]|uniref:Ribonuclease H1 N-terminal domain-containing protein n=1 Tax=Jaapia argillacea MUCL 33604 TaxID=933084 RepID=A0A067Q1X1_9AGAM|nr:hypothetical protein JAAARDRAFT_69592 [Jaapia argillacea MUCL 33604]